MFNKIAVQIINVTTQKYNHIIMLKPCFKCFRKNCKNNLGFSLTELMVVLVIVGILAIGVVFMFADPTAKVKAAAFEMRGDLNLARAEAVKRNENILVDFIFSACSQADVDDTANPCAAVCGKVDKAGFDECYSATGTNQGYVICFDVDGDNDCSDEVLAASEATDLEEKVIKTVIFKDPVKFFAEISGSLPSSPTGPTPNSAPDGITLVGNNGITLGVDYIYMNPDGTSSHFGSVVLYFPQNGDPTTLTVKGKPYAVVVDSVSTGRVVLQRWRPDLGASGEWSRK